MTTKFNLKAAYTELCEIDKKITELFERREEICGTAIDHHKEDKLNKMLDEDGKEHWF